MVFLIIVVAIVAWVVFAYNRLVSLRNQVDNSWRQIDVQLKRRHDLIPNLVEAVKGYMQFERDTLTRSSRHAPRLSARRIRPRAWRRRAR